MIGYFYLAIVLLAGLVKGFLGKGISRDISSLNDGFKVNTIRSAFCSAIGLIVVLVQVGFSGLALSLEAFLVCCASSIFMAIFCISWLYAYKSEAYMFLSIFTMLASVVTAIMGYFIYGDEIKTTSLIGFVLLFVSVYVMSLYNKNLKGKMTKIGLITLIVGGLGVAFSDFMQKVFIKNSLGQPSVFTFYTYFLMLIPQIIILSVLDGKNGQEKKNRLLGDRKHVAIILIISIALYVNVIMKTVAVSYIPSTKMYPTLQGANLVASSICASLFFKEKITPKSIVSMAIALSAVVLMNL